MSLDRAIASGKEHRRPYRGSASFDQTCRPHGGAPARVRALTCPWCERNRTMPARRIAALVKLAEAS